MKRIASIISTILVLSISIFILGGCQSTQSPKSETGKKIIKIAYLPITHALPVFEVEKLTANNPDIQVELVKFGSWPEVLDALKSGSVDGASILIELAMKARSQDIGVKAVALGHKDGNAIIVGNDINTAEDLRGKKFAIPHRLSSHNILLLDLLTKNGLLENDIEIIEMAPPEMPSALATGQISGYCVAEPFGSKSVVLGSGKALYQSEDLWEDSLCCALVLTDKFINENKTDADKFITSYIEAGKELTSEEAKAIAIKNLNQDEKTIDLSLQWISYDDLVLTEEVYNNLVGKIENYKIFEPVPTYEEFVYQVD